MSDIKNEDLRIDTCSTNTHVRITHIPTGMVAGCKTEKTQYRNKDKAMRDLIEKVKFYRGHKEMREFKLCYVDEPFAYFTTDALKDQTGDDWDDAPYEHNAGEPYHEEGFEVIKIAYDAQLDTPLCHHCNSPFSVDMINSGAIAWLFSASWQDEQVSIPAGTTIEEFKRLIEEAGGKTYEVIQRATASSEPVIWDAHTGEMASNGFEIDKSVTINKIPNGTSGGVLKGPDLYCTPPGDIVHCTSEQNDYEGRN